MTAIYFGLLLILLASCGGNADSSTALKDMVLLKPYDAKSAKFLTIGDVGNSYFLRINSLSSWKEYRYSLSFKQHGVLFSQHDRFISSNGVQFIKLNKDFIDFFLSLENEVAVSIEFELYDSTNIEENLIVKNEFSLIAKNQGQIYTFLDLFNIGYNNYSELQNNLDYKAFNDNYPSKDLFKPIPLISGTIEGNNYTISNLYLEQTATSSLFLVSDNATIQNLKINLASDGFFVSSYANVSILIAESRNSLNLANIHVRGQILGLKAAGGLIGIIRNGRVSINNSSFIGTIKNAEDIGGLVGIVEGAEFLQIKDSFADMTGLIGIASNDFNNFGGFVGEVFNVQDLTIQNSYFLGEINSYHCAGIISCTMQNSVGKFENVFYDMDLNRLYHFHDLNLPGIHGKSTYEMKLKSTFTNWDFINIWRIKEGASYPYFTN